MDLAAATFGLSDRLVEPVSPVDSEHADDRQINPRADADRPLDQERIELLPRLECVTAFRKYQTIDRGRRLQDKRVAYLHRVLVRYAAVSRQCPQA